MGIISNDSIKIRGLKEPFELRDLNIEIKPNKHGKAILSIRVKEEGKPSNIIKNINKKMVSIHSSEKGNSGLLFKGYITECKINSRESSGIVYVELTSTSMELDNKYENESYQKKGESYKKIIETVASKSKGINSYCSGDLKKEKLEKPIIQYKETNWEFIKRIASRFRLPVIADVTTDKPTFTIGYNQQSSAEEKDFIKAGTTEFIRMGEYCIRKSNEDESKVTSKDYKGMIVKSYKNLNIGCSVVYGGNNYIICSKKVRTEGAQLIFIYELGSEKLYSLEPIYNERLVGRCLEGTVVKTEAEFIKLQLDIDKEKKSETELYNFKWMPDTGNLMYTMPEKDTVVSLYIGGNDEGDAIVINALRKKDGKDIDNPDNKYYTTVEGKRIYLKEKEIGLSNEAKDEGKIHLKIDDKDGVTFSSAKKIYMEAEKIIHIKSGNKLTVSGNKLLQIIREKEGVKFKNKIDIIGSKKKFDFGIAMPEQLEEAKKVTIKNTGKSPSGKELTPEQTKINEMFRGDQFRAENSFNASVPEGLRADLVALNVNCSCILGENLQGGIETNDKYYARFNDEEVKMRKKLAETRENVSPITKDTVMQKVIPKSSMEGYVNNGWNTVRNCASKASDAAPYVNNADEVYKNLRLDYAGGGNDYRELAEKGGKVYVMRFTSSTCPDNTALPNRTNGNTPPCTETGFTGSDNCLIPEMMYEESSITNGAIYEIDKDGNEAMVGYWNGKRFAPVDEKENKKCI